MRSPQAQQIITALFANRAKPLPSISELRQIMLRDMAGKPLPTGIEVISGQAGAVSGEWIAAPARSRHGTMLFLHGGAHIAGGSATHQAFAARLAQATGLRIFIPDYRLAPEHPFPAGLEDAVAVYDDLEAQRMRDEPLFIAGDSSGGGLCLALLFSLLAAQRPMPRAAIMLSPWTDLTISGESYRTRADLDPVNRVPMLRKLAGEYAPTELRRDPLVSPLFGDPTRLPPFMLQVGDHETLLDDSVQLARKARAAGVSVTLNVWPEMWHGWQLADPSVPETTSAIQEIAAYVHQHSVWAPLERVLQDEIDSGKVSGAVSLVWHGGGIAHASAQGWRDFASRAPMQLDTIFRLFSMTKPVTAAAMMILWDEGKWTPEDPIAKYLPELKDLKVYRGCSREGVPILTPPASPPTLEQLMTHQAGFSYGFLPDAIDETYREAGVPALPSDITPDDYLGRLAKTSLAFDPGSAWRYSVSMDLQGIIVERCSGQSLRDFMSSRIFRPLGMSDTDFLLPAEKRNRLATLYAPSAGGLQVVLEGPLFLSYEQPPCLASGGGGLLSTAADYLRFGRMLLHRGSLDGERVLSEAAAGLMMRSHTPPSIATQGYGVGLHVVRPGYEYAYNGIVVNDPERAAVALGRNTYLWDGAANTWFWVDPSNEAVFVGLVQLLIPGQMLDLPLRTRQITADKMLKPG